MNRTGRKIQRLFRAGVVVATIAGVAFVAPTAYADGTETLGPPSVTIASGSGTSIGGIGLHDGGPGSFDVNVPLGATVEQVLLYWEGLAMAEASGFDDTATVNGNSVTGTLIGGPTRFFIQAFSSSYRADITSLGLVTAGTSTLTVGDIDFSRTTNGAGVVVIWDDGSASDIQLRDGNDLAFVNFAPTLDTTVPQVYNFAAAATDRVADLAIHVGSVVGPDLAGNRPNVIEVIVDGVVTRFIDELGSNNGEEWDSIVLPISVPSGATSLSVQLLSEDDADPDSGDLPASLAWVASSISLPLEIPDPGIDIEKATNGSDADGVSDADVPQIAAGDVVTWTYVVTNTGDVPFAATDVDVADDIPGVTPIRPVMVVLMASCHRASSGPTPRPASPMILMLLLWALSWSLVAILVEPRSRVIVRRTKTSAP